MSSPTLQMFKGSGPRIAYFEWGAPDGQAVFLIHATGFHARCWDRVIAALPPGFRAIAPDTRGHGLSERAGRMTDWSLAGRDAQELAAHLDLRGAIGVGHSKGGHTLVQVAAAAPERFERLLLIDPVLLAPETYRDGFGGARPSEHPVSRRRNVWSSWEEMFESFRDRYPFSLWQPDILADYCRFGLVKRPNGEGYELACPPEIEASVYLGSCDLDIWDLAKSIPVPVTVMRARPRAPDTATMDFASSPTWPGAAGIFPRGRDVSLPHLTHFIPMQDPALVARFIADPDAQA